MEEAKKARGTMAKQINVTTEQSFQDAFDGRVLVEAKGTELMHHCKYRAVGEDPYGSELYRGLLMDCPASAEASARGRRQLSRNASGIRGTACE